MCVLVSVKYIHSKLSLEMINIIDIIIVVLVYGLIAARGVKGFMLPPWVAMLIGAILMLTIGGESVSRAYQAINLNVIFFLFSIFTLTAALEVSGFLKYLAVVIMRKSKKPSRLILFTLLTTGILAMLASNDGISATWTPVILESKKLGKIDEKALLYTLAFGVTIGSVMMPTGNPQNLLIALDSTLSRPFTEFLIGLSLPTIVNLFVTYYLILKLFRVNDNTILEIPVIEEELIQDKFLAYLSAAVFAFMLPMFFITEVYNIDNLTPVSIAVIGSTVIYALSDKRREIIRRVDWSTLVFFVSLFVFTEGIMESGLLGVLSSIFPLSSSIASILAISVLYSQILSNVPMVALYIPVLMSLHNISAADWLALAAGSTIAGNLTLLGAASNIIISEASEIRGGRPLYFVEFIKYGSLVTLVNVIIYYVFLKLFVLFHII